MSISESSASQSPASTQTSQATSPSLGSLAYVVRPYSHSAVPAGALSSLFFTSCFVNQNLWTRIKPGVLAPPLYQRFGFGAALGLASYALYIGDKYNGSGIATAWSLGYLFFNLRTALRAPRHPFALLLAGSASGTAALYGSEYFFLQS